MPSYLPMWLEKKGKGYQYVVDSGGKSFHSPDPGELGFLTQLTGKPIKWMGLKT